MREELIQLLKSHAYKTAARTGSMTAFVPMRTSATEIDERGRRKGRIYMLHPDSWARALLELMSILAIIHDTIMFPFLLAWNPELHLAADITVRLTSLWWTFDLVMNFFTGYYDADREIVFDRMKIARKYFASYFILDATVVACDWFSLITSELSSRSTENLATINMVRLVRLSRLLRLLALARLIRIVHRVRNMNMGRATLTGEHDGWNLCDQGVGWLSFAQSHPFLRMVHGGHAAC